MKSCSILWIRNSPFYRVVSFISSFLVIFQSVALGFLVTSKPSYATDLDPVINEVVVYPSTGAKWIEIYNPNSSILDIGGWKLNNDEIIVPSVIGGPVLTFISGTTISANGYLVVEEGSGSNKFTFNLDHNKKDITLFKSDATVVTTLSYPSNPGTDKSWGWIPNGSIVGTLTNIDTPTKGFSNDPVVDATPPTASINFSGTGSAYKGFTVVFSESVTKSQAENGANYYLTNWPGAGGSGDLLGDATITYDDPSKTATVSFTSSGWYISPEQLWGVTGVHDLAGNLMTPDPTEKTSTPMESPTTAINYPENSAYNLSAWTGSITGVASDPNNGSGVKLVEVKINDGSWIAVSGTTAWSYTYAPPTNGDYTISVKSIDNAGNVSDTKSVNFTFDTIAPQTVASEYSSNWQSSSVTINFTCNDSGGSGCDKTYYTTNGTDPTTESSFGSSVVLTLDGIYTIKFFSTDNASNSEEITTLESAVKIDKTAPTNFELTSPTNGAKINDATPILNWEDSGDTGSGLAGYEAYLDGSKISGDSIWNTTVFPVTGTLVDGEHGWYVKALDVVGLFTESEHWTFTVDTKLPSSEIVVPENNETNTIVYINSWDGVVSGTASDNTGGVGLSKVQLSVQRIGDDKYWDGASWITSEFEWLLDTTSSDGFATWTYNIDPDPESDETYILISHATDLANNFETSYKLTVVYDVTIPEVDLTINPTNPDGENSWYVAKPQITLTGTDANFNKMEYQLNSQSGTWVTYSIPVTVNEGTTKFYYRASDLAGNLSEVGLKNVKVDLTNPDDPEDFRTEAEDSIVTLEWDNSPSDDIDHYTIYRSENKNFIPNPESELKEVSSTTRSYDDEDVDNDTKYYYYIIAFDEAGRNSDAVGAYATPATTEEETEVGVLPVLFVPQGAVAGAETVNTEGVEGAGVLGGTEKAEEAGTVQGTTTEENQNGNTNVATNSSFSLLKYWWLFLLVFAGILGVYLYKKSD